jgi:hypothetical protein
MDCAEPRWSGRSHHFGHRHQDQGHNSRRYRDERYQIQSCVKLRESKTASLLASRDNWIFSRALSD